MRPTAVVVDDDALARARLRDLVEEVPAVELIGEAGDGGEAVEVIDRLKPDIVFLDIEMPVLSGLEVAKRISHEPVIIFTTAYGHYAVTAFELAAVDYLLKPFDAARFRQAVERAVATLEPDEAPGAGRSGARRSEVVGRAESALSGTEPLSRIYLQERGRIIPLPVEDIVRFEADGDYTVAYTESSSYLLRLRLQELQERLEGRFLRIHRSHLVNLDYIRHFDRHDESRLAAVLADGTRLVVSRARSRELRRLAR